MRALFALALLGVPLLVITELPRFMELVGSVQATSSPVVYLTPTPALRLSVPLSTATRPRSVVLDDVVPPTLAPPPATATLVATPRAAPTGEKVMIGNTGGQGAVLRSDPVTGKPLGTLRDKQVLDVIERRNISGSGDWVRVRTTDGAEGWVTGLAALPAPRTP